MNAITEIDFRILNFIYYHFSCGFLNFLMPVISFIGNYGMVWIAAAAALIFIKGYRMNGVLILIGLLTGLLIGNLFLKNVLALPRPCWLNDQIKLLIAVPADYSFPSGHSLSSFIAATLLTLTNRKFGYFAFPLAFLIAFSRLYLYVHFPTDVVAGSLLGVLIGFSVWKLFSLSYFERFLRKNVKTA